MLLGHTPRDPQGELLLPLGQRLAAEDAGGVAHCRADQRERRARAERIAAPLPYLELRERRARPLDELLADPRFSGAGWRCHQRGPGHALGGALLDQIEQRPELPIPAHARRWPPQQGPGLVADLALAPELEALLRPCDSEAQVQKPGGHL